MAATQTCDRFLAEVSRLLREKNAAQLQEYLIIEPPYPEQYVIIQREVRNAFPKGKEDALLNKCTTALPEARNGEDDATWTAFINFMVQYFAFLRDVNVENLLDTYDHLAELVQ